MNVSVDLTLPDGWSVMAGDKTWNSTNTAVGTEFYDDFWGGKPPLPNPGITVYPGYELGGYLNCQFTALFILTGYFPLPLWEPDTRAEPENDYAYIRFGDHLKFRDYGGGTENFKIEGHRPPVEPPVE